MIWRTIGEACQRLGGTVASTRTGRGPFYFFPVPATAGLSPTYWMIGEYRHLSSLATKLRQSTRLQGFVGTHRVRLGLRGDDVPPTAAWQPSFGDLVAGSNASTDFTAQRSRPLLAPVSASTPSDNRRTDREDNVRTYWATQTPQSHHIVEYNHLEAIGESLPGSAREIDYDRLPCVLLAAEFHQRYVTEVLRVTRGDDEAALRRDLGGVYRDLYTRRSMFLPPLWTVSQIILGAARVPLPPS